MSPIESSSLNSGKHNSPTAVNSGSLEGLFKHISALASSSESQTRADPGKFPHTPDQWNAGGKTEEDLTSP